MPEIFKKGEAPWESGGFKKGEAPWEIPSSVAGAPVYDAQQTGVTQEQHPDIGFSERAKIQNLSQGPEVTKQYLESKGFEVKDVNGQMAVRKPGENQFKVIDPLGLDPQDITDVGYDIPAGVASGIAAAGGGLLGGIPGAAAAGGSVSAGAEALRQKLGGYSGLPQNVNPKDVAIAGAAGAVGPALFGTGIAGQEGKGLIAKGYNFIKEKALPKTAEFFSGVPSTAVKTYAKNPVAVNMLSDELASRDLVETTTETLRSKLAQYKSNVGKKLGEELRNVPPEKANVDLEAIKKPIDDMILKLESSQLADSPDMIAEINKLKQSRDSIFKQVTGSDIETGKPILQERTGVIDPVTALELQQKLRDHADLTKLGKNLGSRFGESATQEEKMYSDAARDSYNNINDQLNNVTSGMSSKLKSDYKDYIQLQKELSSKFSNPERSGKTLENLNSPANKNTRALLEKASESTGGEANVKEAANLLEASKYFAKPSLTPISTTGSNTGRAVSLGAIGGSLGYKLAGPAGFAVGAGTANMIGSPATLKNLYIPAARGAANVLEPIANKLYPVANPAAQSIWNTLQRRKK